MPLSFANLSCPYLRAVWLRKKAGGFSCRNVLGILLLRLQVANFELEMRERTFRTILSHLKTEVAMFELELRERAYFAARAGAAAGMHFANTTLAGAMGNALRAQLLHLKVAILQPELWVCSSRATFAIESCDFQAGAAADQAPKIGAAPQPNRSFEEGPVRPKLSPARQVFATTAMALGLRLSQRRGVTRQEDITAWALPSKNALCSHKKRRVAQASSKNTPASQRFPQNFMARLPSCGPCQPKRINVNGATARRTCQREPPFCARLSHRKQLFTRRATRT